MSDFAGLVDLAVPSGRKVVVEGPQVFVDMGRLMSDGSPALLKTRQHMRRVQADPSRRTQSIHGMAPPHD